MDKYIEFDTDSKKTVASGHTPLKIFLKLRGFSRIDLPCIDICYNALPIQYLWFFKARGHTSGAPGSRKKACSSGLIELNILVCVSVFRAIWGIFDQGPCREIRWKSFISPASPITEPNGDCHKCLNGGLLQPDSQTNPEGQGKSPKFEIIRVDISKFRPQNCNMVINNRCTPNAYIK